MKKSTIIMIVCVLLMAACGQSYEETKRQKGISQREAMRKDSAALKVAVMPTLDCLPLYVAEHYQLFDTLRGGVRLKFYMAQMDCDTALLRGRVEGAMTDLVRAKRMERQGMKLRYPAVTAAYWQLIANRNARVKQLKQLDDKMVAMTRYSATDLLADFVLDSAKLQKERLFKIQVNDVNIRLKMLINSEIDAVLLTEPQASVARQAHHQLLLDSRKIPVRFGVISFREKSLADKERQRQLEVFKRGYNQACDSLKQFGVGRYRELIVKYCNVKENQVDSLMQTLQFEKITEPSEADVERARKWLKK